MPDSTMPKLLSINPRKVVGSAIEYAHRISKDFNTKKQLVCLQKMRLLCRFFFSFWALVSRRLLGILFSSIPIFVLLYKTSVIQMISFGERKVFSSLLWDFNFSPTLELKKLVFKKFLESMCSDFFKSLMILMWLVTAFKFCQSLKLKDKKR